MLMFFAAAAALLGMAFGRAALSMAVGVVPGSQVLAALMAIAFMLCVVVLAIVAAVERLEKALVKSSAAKTNRAGVPAATAQAAD